MDETQMAASIAQKVIADTKFWVAIIGLVGALIGSFLTMSAVIGADESETKRLPIKANARDSEKADGKWSLIKNHPFPSSQ